MKRIFDLLGSFILLILLLPLFILIIFLQLILNRGDVFYFQGRVGIKGETFYIWKFATMLKDSANLPGGYITKRNDPRVTKFGKFLRLTKINELPQVINVFLGNMSFVGPRPLVESSIKNYPLEVQAVIKRLKPGITGISSIIFRDEERWVSQSTLPSEEFYKSYVFPYKSNLELWYDSNKSLSVDFIIILLTVIKIILPETKLEFKIFRSLPVDNFIINL